MQRTRVLANGTIQGTMNPMSISPATASPPPHWGRRLWQWLTALPNHDPATPILERHQAAILQQLAVACLVTCAVGVTFVQIYFDLSAALHYTFLGIGVVAFILIAMAALLNRAKYYQAGAILVPFAMWLGSVASAYVLSTEFFDLRYAYATGGLPAILMTSMLFPQPRRIWLAGLLNVLSTLTVHLLVSDFSWDSLFSPLFTVCAITLCTVVAHVYRNTLENERQAELITSNSWLCQQTDQNQRLARGLTAILNSTDQLLTTTTLDQLWQRGTELARKLLGVERSSILEYDSATDALTGTYGTSLTGTTVKEYGKRFFAADEPWIQNALLDKSAKSWTIQHEADIYAYIDGVNQKIAKDWTTLTPISNHAGVPSALMLCNGAISGRPFDPLEQNLVSVYCTLLGGIVERKRAEMLIVTQRTALQASNAALTQQRDQHERLSTGLTNILNASDELLAVPDLDQLWKRGNELVRALLGTERSCIFEHDVVTGEMRGTYGTDIHGATTDEHSKRLTIADDLWLVNVLDKKREKPWLLRENTDQVDYRDGKHILIGQQGWVAYTVISSRNGVPTAMMHNDDAISNLPFDPIRQDLIGLYCSLLGGIAECKRAEASLAQNIQELWVAKRMAEESSRIKSEFLSIVSHELRTPLNAIIGFSDMLLMGMSGDMNPKQHHKMSRLRENGVRLLTLINNVLDLTRLEARRVEIINKPFSPHDLVERISAQTEILAQQKGLQLQLHIDPNTPRMLLGDEQRVEQVVVNLLSNAFKFTEMGSVTLMVDTLPEAALWRIRVVDTGIGIPPHAINLIFEEFRQVDGGFNRAYKGSGLGLSITRNLIQLMRGHVSVDSVISKGSTFTVTLPLLKSPTIGLRPLAAPTEIL